ncbi:MULTISPECIES: 6-phosphogluconolactonase [Brenneria]|uniref:6-phosphogluconolactonase n=1 Tax=Brenneria nigrifluens DSM 30175 = ATCC 13028 TaxID=1121120 RepID=A0A2U1UX37_9GAMM|nr:MULTISPECIES: 6-phosphogluconolactonase [Brenneria]EHD22438.1 6-phosphogluconolactonase [Brenneria sp. EniD312]PWC26182.1 6-phosphogluconolactonase [Brenneria nigrifluens DSM 30175 = ATCC 13028]QCR05436.1 6-phosphogluconolactonase [Brenneria nigrifluens DSM 30175 = ATCC 13028]
MQQVVYVASPESQQIHVWQLGARGELTLLQVVEAPGQVQPMVIAPDRRHLYVGVRPAFSVISYRIDDKGLLTEAGSAPLPGSPTHLSTDRQGRFLFSASYSGASVSVSPIDENGLAGAPIQQLDGLEGCHSTNIDPTNSLVWAPCLKEDRIRLYDLSAAGELSTHQPADLTSVAGAGPRHMAFHPNQRFAYCVNELNSSVDVYQLNAPDGKPRRVQTLDAMPADFADTRWAADIHITPDGRFLYASDRTASLLSIFQVSEDGSVLSLSGHQPTETQPRGFNIDHRGEFLISAGQKSRHIEVYRINAADGALQPLARYAVGQGPMWVSILALG